jgi:hypothetical protein
MYQRDDQATLIERQLDARRIDGSASMKLQRLTIRRHQRLSFLTFPPVQ